MIDKNNLTSTQIILPQNYVLSIPSYVPIDLVFVILTLSRMIDAFLINCVK